VRTSVNGAEMNRILLLVAIVAGLSRSGFAAGLAPVDPKCVPDLFVWTDGTVLNRTAA